MYVHKPVLLNPVLSYLETKGQELLLVDATIGEGGHAEAFLAAAPELRLAGVEKDETVIEIARERLARFGKRVCLFRMSYREFFARYDELLDLRPGRIFFDLGVSMFHYQTSGRGFSFSREEPLDMRMNRSKGTSAGRIVNGGSESELRWIIRYYGQERYAAAISRAIVRTRVKQEIDSAKALADIVRSAVPAAYRYGRIHPATRTFQALRIAVNDELTELEETLPRAFELLAAGGRMGIISFHSLEDRIVKRFFQERNKSCTCPPESPICQCGGQRQAVIVTRKSLVADEAEIAANPASRSARLRVLEKIA